MGIYLREYYSALSKLTSAVKSGVCMGLGMPANQFDNTIANVPTEYMTVMHSPEPDLSHLQEHDHPGWAVEEHSDYGLIGLIYNDNSGGLEVRLTSDEWIEVPADESVFTVILGDMLDKITEGRYKATPHRVLNIRGKNRISIPFFSDPSWDAEVTPLPLSGSPLPDDKNTRWDGRSIRAWNGPYGSYLTEKFMTDFPHFFTENRL